MWDYYITRNPILSDIDSERKRPLVYTWLRGPTPEELQTITESDTRRTIHIDAGGDEGDVGESRRRHTVGLHLRDVRKARDEGLYALRVELTDRTLIVSPTITLFVREWAKKRLAFF